MTGHIRVLSAGGSILILGIVASLCLAVVWRASARKHEAQAFRSAAANVTATLSTLLQRNFDLTRTIRAIATMNPNIGESAFVKWSEQLQLGSRADGGLLIFFIRQVPRKDLASYLRAAARDPVFSQILAGQSQIVPAGDRPRYCLVQGFLDTGNTHSSLPLLVDLCAPTFPGVGRSPYPALLQAMTDTGTMRAVPEPAVKTSEIVTGDAVYRSDADLATIADRRAAVIGWVGSSFDGASVIDGVIAGRKSLAVALFHQNAGDPLQLLSSAGRAGSNPLSYTRQLQADGSWLVKVSGSAGVTMFTANQEGLLVLGCGLLITGLVFLLYLVLSRARARALKLVAQKTDQLHYQTLHDVLTGLPNRALVIDRAEQLLSRVKRTQSTAAALFVDLDGFKAINDRFGHHAGDDLLQTVAARLTTVLRDSDTVGRIGGDEFIVLVEPGALDVTPELVAERILDVLRQPMALGPNKQTTVSLTASIGIADGQRESAEKLLRDADVALYEAKRTGRDRYVRFDSAMQATAQDRLLLTMDLREALERDEFFLLYQPTFDLQSERVTGLEALIRWRHPSRGVVAPGLFIGLAEESGVIVSIGRWVLGEACRQAASWRRRGHPVALSINVSARQLEREDLVDDVQAALAESELDPSSLTLEITETALMRDAEATARLLERIKELGVRIAIDDFGTGYSSLAYLRQFPVDELKIDRAFITGLTRSADSRALAHTLIQLGKALGLQTLAEGIEEPAQLETLRQENCDLGQGFLFARPLDPAAVERFLSSRTASQSAEV